MMKPYDVRWESPSVLIHFAGVAPKVTLPMHIRGKWMSDPVRNPEWRSSIHKWNNVWGEHAVASPMETNPLISAPTSSTSAAGFWGDEPGTAAELHSKYNIQEQVATDDGHGTLALTECNKLFICASETGPLHVSMLNMIIGHAGGDWLRPPKSEEQKNDAMAFPFVLEHDTQSVILETMPPGKRTPKDTEKCSWRTLLIDMETEGLIDSKVHGHDTNRPDGAVQTDAEDYFVLRPIEGALWVWKGRKPAARTAKSWSTIASWLTAKQLLESPELDTAWRVSYETTSSTLLPKKPVFFAKSNFEIPAQGCRRMV